MANRSKWVLVAIAAAAAGLAGSGPVLARITVNTIDATASLSAGGRIAEGAALIDCTEGERIEITVTFIQGDVTGAMRERCPFMSSLVISPSSRRRGDTPEALREVPPEHRG